MALPTHEKLGWFKRWILKRADHTRCNRMDDFYRWILRCGHV